MSNVKIWLMQIRAPFLVLTPISVLVGVSVAVYESYPINALYLALAFIGALLAHIAVNVLNEYFDYKSGVDFKTVRTPFSGGSGVLVEGLLSPRSVYIFGLACVAAIIAIGGYFFHVHGAAILPLGALGLVTVYFYTTYLTKSPLLCAIAPGLGFGPLMVMGPASPADSHREKGKLQCLCRVACGCLRGASHPRGGWSPAVYGIVRIYVALVIPVAVGILPYMALFGLLTLPLGFVVVRGARQYYDQIEGLVPVMGRNVLLTLLLPLLMAIGIIVS
jgi:1,4-dihydroxy-2-naphthoate octaprenyltransferase